MHEKNGTFKQEARTQKMPIKLIREISLLDEGDSFYSAGESYKYLCILFWGSN
jgi:hypothetical protein